MTLAVSKNLYFTAIAAIVATAAGISLYCLHQSKLLKQKLDAEDAEEASQASILENNEGCIALELMDWEAQGVVYADSVNSITFYDGFVLEESIRSKVDKICESNPWLLSRLIKSTKSNQKIVAVYTPNTANSAFAFVKNPAMGALTGYADLVRATDPHRVKTGIDSLNKNEPLFKVTLIEIVPHCKYALVVSMSHVLGDGHTFYNIYSMLDKSAEVRALIATRQHSFEPITWQATGGKVSTWLQSPFVLWGFFQNLLWRRLPRTSVFSIDSQVVSALKQAYIERYSNSSSSNKGGAFISTNDILTSWFFSLCRSSFGLMAVNFRNRHADFTDQHAGNYEIVTLFSRSDFAKPEYIRSSLKNYRSLSDSVPNVLETLLMNVSIISNWASLYKHIELSDECKHLVHYPLLNPGWVGFADLGIIFNLNQAEVGMLFLTRGVDVAQSFSQKTDACSILKKCLLS